MTKLDPVMQVLLTKREELLKVKAEQVDLNANEAEGQAVQLQAAR